MWVGLTSQEGKKTKLCQSNSNFFVSMCIGGYFCILKLKFKNEKSIQILCKPLAVKGLQEVFIKKIIGY